MRCGFPTTNSGAVIRINEWRCCGGRRAYQKPLWKFRGGRRVSLCAAPSSSPLASSDCVRLSRPHWRELSRLWRICTDLAAVKICCGALFALVARDASANKLHFFTSCCATTPARAQSTTASVSVGGSSTGARPTTHSAACTTDQL